MDTTGEQSLTKTYSMLSWFGAIGVASSLYVAGQYFEHWLDANDPADHPLVEAFIERPVEMLTERPAVMATKPILSVALAGFQLARLCFRWSMTWLTQYWRVVLDT